MFGRSKKEHLIIDQLCPGGRPAARLRAGWDFPSPSSQENLREQAHPNQDHSTAEIESMQGHRVVEVDEVDRDWLVLAATR